MRESDPLEAEGQRLEVEMAQAVREAQRLGRSMTGREERAMFERTAGLRQRIADRTARRLVEGRPEVRTHDARSRARPPTGGSRRRGPGCARARGSRAAAPAARRPTC